MFLVVMGAAFALVGGVVDIGVGLGRFPGELIIMGSIFVVVGLVLLAVGGVMVRGARRRAHVLATGIAGTALITSVRQTSVRVNDQPVIAITLTVRVPGRPEYPVTVRQVIPFIRLPQIQPGRTLAVKVAQERPEEVVIDWAAPVGAGAPVAAAGMPAGPPLPGVPGYAANLPPDQLREQVRSIGATGRAIIDAVQQTGPQDGKVGFQLGMWVQLDSGPAFRVDNAPAAVETRYAVLVRPGITVPLRIAQVRPGVTMTVLEWEKLADA